MQIMSCTLPDTYINAWVNTVIQPLGNLLKQSMAKTTKTDHLFKILMKCNSKFDRLVYEMLYIKDIKPSLNTQADSIRAKLFTWNYRAFIYLLLLLLSFYFFITLGIIPIGPANI